MFPVCIIKCRAKIQYAISIYFKRTTTAKHHTHTHTQSQVQRNRSTVEELEKIVEESINAPVFHCLLLCEKTK